MAKITPDFEPDVLADYLGGGDLTLSAISGGQSNPTWLVTYNGERLVLRKKPAGKLLKGAHAIEREYRVMQALQGTNVPVPKLCILEEDDSILGTPFYIMDYLEGRVFDESSLPDFQTEERAKAYQSAAEILAQLHQINVQDVGLETYGRPDGYFARQIAIWGGQVDAIDHPDTKLLQELHLWFKDNIPQDTMTTLTHGDYRIGNLMYHPTLPQIAGVLDWELSTLGHPLADLSHFGLFYHVAPEESGGLSGLDLTNLGIPEFAQFHDTYRAAGGCEEDMTPFHHAFGLFRMGAIFAGIGERHRKGQTSAANAADIAAKAPRLARLAADIL